MSERVPYVAYVAAAGLATDAQVQGLARFRTVVYKMQVESSKASSDGAFVF